MSHVLICGAAGFTNLGDDSILWGMLTDLRRALGGRRIEVVGGPDLASLTAPFEAGALSYEDRDELARAVEDADLVILGGGGLLYDVDYDASLARMLGERPDRQWLFEMARIAAAARAAGRPVMVYAVGVGPLLTESARRAARFIAEQAGAVTVRDAGSAELLADCGLARSRVQVAADPAVAVEPGPAEAADAFLNESGLASAPRPWIALNLRPWYRSGGVEVGTPGTADQFVERAGRLMRKLTEEVGGTLVCLPLQRLNDDDGEVLSKALEAAGKPERAVLADARLSPPDLVAALARFDLMVGMRLHSLVLALAAGIPFVGLPYAPKVSEFGQAAGLADHLHPVDGLDAEAVVASCRRLLADHERVVGELAKRRDEMRAASRISAELAAAMLGPGAAPRPRPAVPPRARPARGLRVLMQTRPDYQSVPGGDVLQLTEIITHLQEAGVEVELTGELTPDLSGYDLVHTINLDRPEDPYQHCLNALRQGRPVVVSPVHTDMTEFLEWGDPDYWDMPDPARGLPEPRRAPLPHPIERRRRALRHWQRQAIIDWSTVYLPNAQMDAEYLAAAFGLDLTRTVVVPHGIASMFFEAGPEPFVEKHGLRDFVISAGRVETRKNQLSLVAALRGAGIALVIVGQPNPEEYRDLCRRYADGSVVFLDAVPQANLASAYAAAKVHALASWFEIPGLVSLEAAAAGCSVVSTDRGSPREYLGDMAWYCDPRRIESIREAVLAAHQAPRSDRLREHIRQRYTWRQAAARTLEAYQLALWLHSQRTSDERQAQLLAATQRHADWLARLAADLRYEVRIREEQLAPRRELEAAYHALEADRDAAANELERAQAELKRVTSRRLYRCSEAVARAGWALLRALGVKRGDR